MKQDYTEYLDKDGTIYHFRITKQDHDYIDKKLREAKATFAQKYPGVDWFPWVLNLLFDDYIYRSNEINSYLKFGPFWHALKDIYIRNKIAFEDPFNAIERPVAKVYRGQTDEHTIIFADEFYRDCSENYFSGNNEFYLGQKLTPNPDFDPQTDHIDDKYIIEDYYFKLHDGTIHDDTFDNEDGETQEAWW